jgi:hypothetical protein
MNPVNPLKSSGSSVFGSNKPAEIPAGSSLHSVDSLPAHGSEDQMGAAPNPSSPRPPENAAGVGAALSSPVLWDPEKFRGVDLSDRESAGKAWMDLSDVLDGWHPGYQPLCELAGTIALGAYIFPHDQGLAARLGAVAGLSRFYRDRVMPAARGLMEKRPDVQAKVVSFMRGVQRAEDAIGQREYSVAHRLVYELTIQYGELIKSSKPK